MRKVLLVDDDIYVRNFLKLMFESCGFSVTAAEDGRIAVIEAEAGMPDLIVLDMNMPVMTGFRTAEELKKKGAATADIPIIAISALTTAEDHTAAHLAGCDAYLEKPIVPERLFEVVERVLSKPPSVNF